MQLSCLSYLYAMFVIFCAGIAWPRPCRRPRQRPVPDGGGRHRWGMRWRIDCRPNDLAAVAWYGEKGRVAPHPVCRKQRNAYGLADMTWNKWEWVSDWYGALPSVSVTDPTGASAGSFRVKRGDAWNFSPPSRGWPTGEGTGMDVGAASSTSASRYLALDSVCSPARGFRPAKAPERSGPPATPPTYSSSNSKLSLRSGTTPSSASTRARTSSEGLRRWGMVFLLRP